MCSKPNPLSLTLTNLPVTKGHHCQGRNQREKIQSALTSSVFTLCLWQPRVPDAAYGQCPYQHCSLSETGSNHCCCSIVSRLVFPLFYLCVCFTRVYAHTCICVRMCVGVHVCMSSCECACPRLMSGIIFNCSSTLFNWEVLSINPRVHKYGCLTGQLALGNPLSPLAL